jgi:hypothetical protein
LLAPFGVALVLAGAVASAPVAPAAAATHRPTRHACLVAGYAATLPGPTGATDPGARRLAAALADLHTSAAGLSRYVARCHRAYPRWDLDTRAGFLRVPGAAAVTSHYDGAATATPSTPTSPTTSVPASPSPSTSAAVYRVTGDGSADVSYVDADGATHQTTVSLPWTLSLDRLPPSRAIGVTAHRTSPGQVTCSITAGTQLVQQASSSGTSPTATCRATL